MRIPALPPDGYPEIAPADRRQLRMTGSIMCAMKSQPRFHPRRVGRILIPLVVLVAAAAALGACSPPFSGACSAKGAATATAASTLKVVADSQKQGAYQPDPVTVQAGQSVTWTWDDQGNQHSVSADDGSFESCLQGAGSTFTDRKSVV